MTKKEDDATPTPVLVVYGLDEKQFPRAACFYEKDFDQARKAATTMKLEHFQSTANLLHPALKKIADGQAYVSGWGFVPRVRKQHYDTLLSVIASIRETPVVTGKNVFPASWDEIQKGSFVIAQADSAEFGWWPCIVEKREDSILTLSWENFPKDPKFRRHFHAVALIMPPRDETVGTAS
jgi:hypothetical protein